MQEFFCSPDGPDQTRTTAWKPTVCRPSVCGSSSSCERFHANCQSTTVGLQARPGVSLLEHPGPKVGLANSQQLTYGVVQCKNCPQNFGKLPQDVRILSWCNNPYFCKFPQNFHKTFRMKPFAYFRERRISPKFSCIKLFRDPSGHGCLRLREKDVHAKNISFLRSQRWGERFWAGTSARISAWMSRPKTLCLPLLFRS